MMRQQNGAAQSRITPEKGRRGGFGQVHAQSGQQDAVLFLEQNSANLVLLKQNKVIGPFEAYGKAELPERVGKQIADGKGCAVAAEDRRSGQAEADVQVAWRLMPLPAKLAPPLFLTGTDDRAPVGQVAVAQKRPGQRKR